MRLTLPNALLVCGCCNKEAPAKADRPAPVAVKTTEPLTPPEPVKAPTPRTLADALTMTRPKMADSVNTPDVGSVGLAAMWQEKGYAWSELSAIPGQDRRVNQREQAAIADRIASLARRLVPEGSKTHSKGYTDLDARQPQSCASEREA